MSDQEAVASQLIALEIVVATLIDTLDETNRLHKPELLERIRLLAEDLRATNKLDLTQKVGKEMVRLADSLRQRVGFRGGESGMTHGADHPLCNSSETHHCLPF